MTPQRAPSLTSRRMAPATGQASPEIVAALERARAFFADRSTRPAVLARGMMAKPLSGDVVLCEHLIRERRRKTRMDGSIHGSLIETTRTLSNFALDGDGFSRRICSGQDGLWEE